MPNILAIETSSELASCALLAGDNVFVRASSGVRTHSQSVLPMVQELLQEAGLALAQLDAVAFGAGPGSFTGVRTACGVGASGVPRLTSRMPGASAVPCVYVGSGMY